MARLARYELTDENEDLEESISRSVEAILSIDPQIGHNSHVVTAFFFLADTLFRRSDKLKRLDDSKHCVRYFRYLRDQSLETSRITRDHTTTAFTRALANHVQMVSSDPTRNVEEMAILCRELLRSDVSDGLLVSSTETLFDAIDDEHFSVVGGRPPPDQAIEYLREVMVRFPDSGTVAIRLIFSLLLRFTVTHSHADYEDAMSIVDGSITDPMLVELASDMAVSLARTRFYFYGNPEYLEEAIFRIRICLRKTSSKNPERQRSEEHTSELQSP